MYEVGQVLFLIMNKRQQVIPIQINEQVVRRSLDGEETSYSVAVPVPKGTRLFDLQELDGQVYKSIEEARDALHDQAAKAINTLTQKAAAVAEHRFGHNEKPQLSLDDIPEPSSSGDDASVKITLEDGTIANVHIPEIPLPEQP